MKEYVWFYETWRLIARLVFPLLVRLRVVGVENVPKTGPVILVSNHLNWTDIPLVGLRVRRTHFMAKAELFRSPPLSPARVTLPSQTPRACCSVFRPPIVSPFSSSIPRGV